MANVDERARHELYLSIESLIGAEGAETLMSMLPPAGWADVATKQDLALLHSELRADLNEAMRNQMRTLVFSLLGALFTMMSLNLTAIALLR